MSPSQTGEFYPGTIGFPLLIKLVDFTTDEIAQIVTLALVVTRPDKSSFSRALGPGDIVSGSVQYLLQSGDLPVGGRYHYALTVNMTSSRVLPLLGSFCVHETDVSVD